MTTACRIIGWGTILFLLGLTELRAEDSRVEVNIGATLPMTGAASFYGVGFKNAASMALEELGPTKYGYSLTVEDDQGSASRATAAFQKLTAFSACPVVFSATANIALAVAPLARQKNVLHLGISSDPVFADAINNFNIWPAPDIPVGALMEQFRLRGIKKAALFGLEHAWPRAVLSKLAQAMKQEHMIVTMHEYFSPGESNLRPLLQRFKGSDSEIGVLLSWSPELELFGRQYRELNITIPLTSEFAFETAQEKPLFNGFWFVNLRTPDVTYGDRFAQRFGYRPYAQMELGDLMIKLVVEAYERRGDGRSLPPLREIAADLLSVKNKPTVIGPIAIRSDGVLDAPYVVKLIRDGKVEEML